MTNISALQDRLETYDQKRSGLLGNLEGLNNDQLRRKGGPDRWSLLEIVQHLVLSEREVLRGLPEPKELTVLKRDFFHRLSYAMVLAVLRWKIPAPVPSDGMVPDGNTSLSELRHLWNENLTWLKDYLIGLRPEHVQKAVFRHPIAGPMNVVQTIHLANLHFDVHLRQIRKLNSSL